jgi:hypothetical protein
MRLFFTTSAESWKYTVKMKGKALEFQASMNGGWIKVTKISKETSQKTSKKNTTVQVE